MGPGAVQLADERAARDEARRDRDEAADARDAAAARRDEAATQRHADNPSLRLAGVIVNAYEGRTRRQLHWYGELMRYAPAPIWTPPVPKATVIGEAVEAGMGLDEIGTAAAAVLSELYDGYLTELTDGARPPSTDDRAATPAGAAR